jgi:hypothetical protein
MATKPSVLDFEDLIKKSYDKHFNNCAYSSWEYAPIIQRSVLREGNSWKTFLETSEDARKKWPAERRNEIRDWIDAIGDNDLQQIKSGKNGDCAVFAAAVITEVLSGEGFTYVGDGEHTLAYMPFGPNDILVIDSMFKKIIKFSTANSPQWMPSRKAVISGGTKYYPDDTSGYGLITKRRPTPPYVEIWRVTKKPGTNIAQCLHLRRCKHKPFKELADWRDAIRQSLTHWTMKGQCVILFRMYDKLGPGPGFDGQIDFHAGKNLIEFKQREFKDGKRHQRKTVFEFNKVKEDQFHEEKDPKKRESRAIAERKTLKLGFIAFVDDFVTMSTTDRSEQFESTRPIFLIWLDKMEIVFGSPRFKAEDFRPV